jgi:3-oxoadipate enol-lactonase
VIGMVLAAEHPDRVRTLSMVSAPVYQSEKSQQVYAAGFPTREQALRTLGTGKWAEAVYGAADFFPVGTDPALRAWYVAEIAKSDTEVLCGLNGLLRHADVRDWLPRIKAPVLSLYPTSGLLTGSEQEALLAAGIRDLRMVRLPTRSHAVLTLYPDECARHVLEFVAARDGLRASAGPELP